MFSSVRISKMLKSWATIINNRLNKNQMPNVIHAALEHYDLPDLVEILGKQITVDHPVNALGSIINVVTDN